MTEADSHIRISGKIKINLERKRKRAEPRRKHRRTAKILNPIRKLGKLVGKHHFLEQAERKPPASIHKLRHGCLSAAKLCLYILIPDNRTGYQMRKQGKVSSEIHQIPLNGRVAAVEVDGVGDALKRIKGDADRERHLRRRDGKPRYGLKRPR